MGFLFKFISSKIFNMPMLCAVVLMIVTLYQSIKITRLENEIQIFKNQTKSLISELNISANSLSACNALIYIQNKAIKENEIKQENKISKNEQRVQKIYIKDDSCKAELKAYKELFNE
ncbi:hypothetical protein [Campylobacter pinnipediorum]|uniref:hypothetical protein n=1 Tax=Campylobacter pinnipediorum TaxID=1965231 RepID=UPI00084DA66A|nr:hypothetical protein [Campylobacter pinnipediorum]AQW80788.1 hypothetical protein CPIN17260_0460 [Campylobacter pinnipediorum subsp. pinnipediorum]AQW83326.1 hypothetical protein CPIN17261_1328 [Campylobacter pinnipediorum subsp. pinnipediorum]OPA75430.1 hypothetical protein BFG05_06035 [Campylobacter pinnipediorum subsp. pinnipediorum]